jgi:isopenicillin-N N-acyltransferase like protein
MGDLKKTFSKVSYIEAGGANYDIGYRIGVYLKEKLISHNRSRQAFYRNFSNKHNVPLQKIVQRSEKLISRYFPAYLEELNGLAAGSSLPLEDILLLGSEETILNSCANNCTTFAYDGTQGVVLGHNEDWAPGYEDKLYVVKATPSKGAAYISLAYLGCLGGSSVALNEYGIAFSGNSLLDGSKPGVPKNIILRSQIEAKNIKEFGQLATFNLRAVPNHSMAVDKKGQIASVEVGLKEKSVYYTSGPYVHTNHVIHKKMMHLESSSAANSIARYRTAKALLATRKRDNQLAKEILRSHAGQPCPICIHPQADNDSDSQTVASAIVNLAEMSLSVTLGNPCRSRYQKFYL